MIFINQRQMCCCLSFIENIFGKEKCKENEMSELISSASFCVKIVSHCPKKNAILRKSLLSCHFLQDPTKRIQKFGETVALLESFVVRPADFSQVLPRGWRCRLEVLLLLLISLLFAEHRRVNVQLHGPLPDHLRLAVVDELHGVLQPPPLRPVAKNRSIIKVLTATKNWRKYNKIYLLPVGWEGGHKGHSLQSAGDLGGFPCLHLTEFSRSAASV